MQPLDKSLRTKLERTVKEARDVAEVAAWAALEQLGVGEPAPYSYLCESERELRRRLRAHGRQLGDERDSKTQRQAIERLVEEVAYEHWHRMLFARFLAENNLLMYPDPVDPVAVTLEECEDLAADEGAKTGWELASRFAARMLPQIFRPDAPVLQIDLPPEYQQKLELLLIDLSNEVFTASDSLGWVYQFWQSKKKKDINNSQVKFGARELPAETQLFTEPYMVSFLLDNSLGAWWSTRVLSEEDCIRATREEQLRGKVSLSGMPLEYLRFVKADDGKWIPAGGTFEEWPKELSQFKVLDPSCGSGHFLVATMLMLIPIRMELEGLTEAEAIDAVLSQNLHGLDIDQRVVEIAAFALALTAWRYPGAGGWRKLPEMHVACSGLSISVRKEQWIALADDDPRLVSGMEQLFDLFQDAPILGSLINPHVVTSDLLRADFETLRPLLQKALTKGENVVDADRTELGITAHGIFAAIELLSQKFHLVPTNVPYVSRLNQSPELMEFVRIHYPESTTNLASAMFERCLDFSRKAGCTAVVLPLNTLNLVSYKKLRKRLLSKYRISLVAKLGPGAFETITGEVVNVALLLIEACTPNPVDITCVLDVLQEKGASSKALELRQRTSHRILQSDQLQIADARIGVARGAQKTLLLADVADAIQGIVTGDAPKFVRTFWENPEIAHPWESMRSTVTATVAYGGRQHVLFWEDGKGSLKSSPKARVQGFAAFGRQGISITQMSGLHATLYDGGLFDINASVLIPKDPDNLPAMWAFCESNLYRDELRSIDQKVNVTTATLAKVPFDLEHWQRVAMEKYPRGLPEPFSSDPTQWVFHGHPAKSDSPLQVAVARLMGYRWTAEMADIALSEEARLWVGKCDELIQYVDDDGIICIPSVLGQASAADRLLDLLAASYGDDWGNDRLSELLTGVDCAGKSFETWLRDKFFTQHCKLFHQRPFIWHIWDGLRDGFAALVNYHKFDRKLLETLVYTYLGDWIKRQKNDIGVGVDGAKERLAAAETLKRNLELILEGEDPYDIFVRWKPIEEQPIGWDPDLNDGVRLNIRPFMSVPDVGKKGAGILRDKPNINWNKDRGKDAESSPWYPVFQGDRINDYHLTLQEKNKARESTGKR